MSDLPRLPHRPRDGHKGTFGTVAIVGGCGDRGQARMLGAPALAARGAARAGAGLVKIAAPAGVVDSVVALCPAATGVAIPVGPEGGVLAHEGAAVLDALAGLAGALVVGPGMGAGGGVEAVVLRAVSQEECPVVLDADALNALAGLTDFRGDVRARLVMTPHPGEFARLAAALRIGESPTDPTTRPRAAERLAQALGCVVVLKGVGSVVSDGQRSWVCARGHPCLATGGTGDVLAGVIGALIAQYAAPPPVAPGIRTPPDPRRPLDLYDCARVGVEAHAVAGERWAEGNGASAGMLAEELADLVPGVLEGMRGKGAAG